MYPVASLCFQSGTHEKEIGQAEPKDSNPLQVSKDVAPDARVFGSIKTDVRIDPENDAIKSRTLGVKALFFINLNILCAQPGGADFLTQPSSLKSTSI